MTRIKRNLELSFLFICCVVFSNDSYSQTKPLENSRCVIGNFTVSVPNGWNSFSNQDKASARSEFASDLEPGLVQYSKAGKPDPKMGDFEIFQKPTDGQLIGWTLLIPDQTDFLKEILKKENIEFEKKKNLSGGQVISGSCRLVKIGGIEVVRVDVIMANGAIATNFHFWSPKNPGVISTLMIGTRPNKSAQTEKEYQGIIESLIVKE
jgi:hypothetical protein